MTHDPNDRASAALYRLLAEAVHGGQAKVDALLALMQRTVFVVPWPGQTEGYRTLVNSTGVAALPIFTERDQLEVACRRYGWLAADGSAPATEIGARQAFHYARTQALAFVVVDIAADHCIEVGREELEPLLSPAARRESSGPFAGAGRISSTLMRAVRPGRPTPAPGTIEAPIRAPTPPPGSLAAARPPSSPGTMARPGSSPGTEPAAATAAAATAGPETSPGTLPAARPGTSPGTLPAARPGTSPGTLPAARPGTSPGTLPAARPDAAASPGTVLASAPLGAPAEPPTDALLDALEAVLRDYPEVEWACVGSHASAAAAVGLRVDPRVRQRVDEIASRLAGASAPGSLPVVLLDDPPHVRAARADALVFYPWRRRA